MGKGDGVKTDHQARRRSALYWLFSRQNAAHWTTVTGAVGMVLGGVAAAKGLPPEIGIGVATAIGGVGGILVGIRPSGADE